MKKRMMGLVLAVLVAATSTTFAAVGDSRERTAELYGEYRLLIDTDNQLWTRDEWETAGHRREKEATLWHQFWRKDQGFQMVVAYENNKPDSTVQIQRISPDNAFPVSELKNLFPEIHKQLMAPSTVVFGTEQMTTRHFAGSKPQVVLGAIFRESASGEKSNFYTLVSFNIVREGRIVKDIKQINEQTLIREFVMERVPKLNIDKKLQERGNWEIIPNYFK